MTTQKARFIKDVVEWGWNDMAKYELGYAATSRSRR